jgi:hypothetical protein
MKIKEQLKLINFQINSKFTCQIEVNFILLKKLLQLITK